MIAHRGTNVVFGALAAIVLAATTVAQAAILTIDDSDPNTVTITASDFEEGFFVNGDLLDDGVPLTLPDSAFSIFGFFVDNGANAPPAGVNVFFALLSDPTLVTSGVQFSVTTDGSNATLSGSIGSFVGAPYFPTVLPTFPQDVSVTVPFTAAFLSGSFTSEAAVAAVPEPGTMVLVASAVPIVLVAWRRRRPTAAAG